MAAENNIQETGPLSYRELAKLNNTDNVERADDDGRSAYGFKSLPTPNLQSSSNPYQNKTMDVYSPLYDRKGDYWGRSRFDRKNPLVDDTDFERVGDLRAEEQSSFSKILNGTIKMVTTAGTTFLDGTVGFLWGLGKGFVNLADNNDDTTFWQGLWDNEFNKAMANAQDAMEKIAPNYYTQRELDNPWYKNIFTANFIGDKFLKNMGFTMGTVAVMATGIGDLGGALGAGTEFLGKAIASGKLLKSTKFANTLMRVSERAGGVVQKLVNTAISANAEASIEAINAVKANKDASLQNLESWKNERVTEVNEWYNANADILGAADEYYRRLQSIDDAVAQANQENDATVANLGNSVWSLNMALLSITNYLEFGKYIKGGYNQTQNISKLKMMIDGVQSTNQKEFGRALADVAKNASFAADEELKKLSAGKVAKVIGGTFARNLEEGFEEGAQNLISDSGQMQAQAIVNQKIGQWASKNDKYNLFAHSVNPEVTEELVDRTKAFLNAWNKNFGSGIDAPGWEEVFLGALTGGIGTLGFKADKATGKIKPSWAGGFWEEYQKTNEEYGRQELLAEQLNKALDDEKFRKNLRHAITTVSLAEDMEKSIVDNDILRFKNAEMMDIAEQTLYWREMGGLEMFRSFYEEMAKQVTDDDITAVKSSFRDVDTGESYFDGVSNDELKQRMQDKAKSTLDKIDSVLESYDWHQRTYGQKITDGVLNPSVAKTVLHDIVGLDTLTKDLERRKGELTQKLESGTFEQGETEDSLRTDIHDIDKSIKEVKQLYDKYTDNPNSLVEEILKIEKQNIRREALKNAEIAKQALSSAKTILNVAETYYSTDPEIRQQVFDEVYETATLEVKTNLDLFKNYLATTQALPTIVNKMIEDFEVTAKESGNPISDKGIRQTRRLLTSILDRVAERTATNPNTSFADPKKIVSDAIKAEADNLRKGEGYDRFGNRGVIFDFYAALLDDIVENLKTYDVVYQAFQKPAPKVEKPIENKEEGKQKEPAIVPENYTTPKFQGGYVILAKNTNDNKDGELLVIDDPTKAKQRKGQVKLWFKNSTGFEGFLARIQAVGFKVHPADINGLKSAYEAAKAGIINNEQFSDLFVRDEYKSTAHKQEGVQSPTESPQGEKKDTGVKSNEVKDKEQSKEEKENKSVQSSPVKSSAENERQESGSEEQAPEASMRGTSFLQYKIDDDRVATPTDSTSTYLFHQIEQAEGIDIDFIQNNYLWKMLQIPSFKDEDGVSRIPVRYLKFNRDAGRGGLNRFIFLATPYTDEVKNVFPEQDRSKLRTVTWNGQEYLIVGSLGTYTNDKAGEDKAGEESKDILTYNEEMFETINTSLTEQVKQNPDAPFQMLEAGENGENTNFIYQVNGGTVIRSIAKDGGQSKTLKELLESTESNPQHLTIEDLAFNVIMGNEETGITENLINTKEGEDYRRLVGNIRPGQVFVYLRDSTGSWIPWMLDTVDFDDIESLPEDNPIRKQVFDAIHHLAEVLADHSYSKGNLKERLVAMGQLRDILLFGSPDVQGTNIFYTPPGEVDELGLREGDTISATLEGQPLEIIRTADGKEIPKPFQLAGQGAAIIEAKLLDMIRALRPNYNIKASTLRQPGGAKMLIDAGVLKAPLRVLGAVNARSYVYPISKDMTPDVTFRVTRETATPVNKGSSQRVWFADIRYRILADGDIIDSKGETVTDPELKQDIMNIRNLTPENKTFTYRRAPYWIVGDKAYTSSKSGRFNSVNINEARAKYKTYLKNEERKKREDAAKKRLEESKKSPIESQTPTEGGQEKQSETKTTAGAQEVSEKSAIFVEAMRSLAQDTASSEQQQMFNTLSGVQDFLDTLGKDAWDVTKGDILALMVGEKLGINSLELTNKQIEDTVWNSKYSEDLRKADAENINDIIDNIIKCGL